MEDQIKRIFKEPNHLFDTDLSVHESAYITDVYHGDIYKNILVSTDAKYILSQEGFTFLINTDGVSLSNKSDLSVWPVFLTINEFKIGSRFCLENIIIAGENQIKFIIQIKFYSNY